METIQTNAAKTIRLESRKVIGPDKRPDFGWIVVRGEVTTKWALLEFQPPNPTVYISNREAERGKCRLPAQEYDADFDGGRR